MHYRSKTVAAWLALTLGTLGLHRAYLYGKRDSQPGLFPLPTVVGLIGVARMRDLGQDDRLAWVLIPVLGLVISVAMLTAIVYALTPDEKWDAAPQPGPKWRCHRLGSGAGRNCQLARGWRRSDRHDCLQWPALL